MTDSRPISDQDVSGWMEETAGKDAGSLIAAIISATATYDHIVDGDKFNAGEVHQMVRDFLVTIPQNRVWSAAPVVFQTIFFNAVSSWIHAESENSYRIKVSDVLSETGCAILQAKGGLGLLLEKGSEWRRLCGDLLTSSDERN